MALKTYGNSRPPGINQTEAAKAAISKAETAISEAIYNVMQSTQGFMIGGREQAESKKIREYLMKTKPLLQEAYREMAILNSMIKDATTL